MENREPVPSGPEVYDKPSPDQVFSAKASDWGEAFLKQFPDAGIDRNEAEGWFASAILAGWDAHRAKMTASELVDRDFIDEVEQEVGMGSGAWDTVSPKDIALAVLAAARRRC